MCEFSLSLVSNRVQCSAFSFKSSNYPFCSGHRTFLFAFLSNTLILPFPSDQTNYCTKLAAVECLTPCLSPAPSLYSPSILALVLQRFTRLGRLVPHLSFSLYSHFLQHRPCLQLSSSQLLPLPGTLQVSVESLLNERNFSNSFLAVVVGNLN